MEIPQYIHYCWFGEKPIPKRLKRYMETWKKWLPEYEIIRWDEKNFPINHFTYAQEAMEMGKMAFVSDVARIYALEKMGGIYFDTDVEVLCSFTDVLSGAVGVLGTEEEGKTIGTGFMAFTPGHPVCKEMLAYYKSHSYLEQDSTLSNTIILADIIQRMYGIRPRNIVQKTDNVIVYPKQYFTAFDGATGLVQQTKETRCIHHFTASWQPAKRRFKDRCVRILNRFGINLVHKGY